MVDGLQHVSHGSHYIENIHLMSTTAVSFFSTEENQAVLRRFDLALSSTSPLEPAVPNVIPSLSNFFRILIANTEVFDQHCATNIEWIGQSFLAALVNFTEVTPEKRNEILVSIFTMAYRFLCELEFSLPGELSFELRGVKNFVDENLNMFSGTDRQQLVYANYVMPANVTKKLINSPALAEFKSFAETARAATDLKATWDKELQEKNVEIAALRAGLEKIKTTYNFIGLVQGFEILASAKKAERSRSFAALLVLGLVMVTPVATQLWFTITNAEAIDTHKSTLIYSLPPLIALEIILIYFFRVVLLNFRSVTTQLLQINLRISLCQFIQSYSEYSAKIKKQDPGALEKFENLIFSSIIPGGESLPSTFDGVDQIAKLVNSIRGK